MKITEVKVTPVRQQQLKAYVTIVFDHCFIVRDIKVISGRKGLFVAMPNKQRKNGMFRDVAHPVNRDMRQRIEQSVLRAYINKAESDKRQRELEAERDAS